MGLTCKPGRSGAFCRADNPLFQMAFLLLRKYEKRAKGFQQLTDKIRLAKTI